MSNEHPSAPCIVALTATLLSISACACPPTAHTQGEPTITVAASGAPQEKTMESPKRRVPNVPPVVAKGIRYEVLRGARSRGFAQNGGVIAAIDVASNKELWTLQVYQTRYDAHEEADVQDVFITQLALSKDGASLLLTNEKKKSYSVLLTDRSITEHP